MASPPDCIVTFNNLSLRPDVLQPPCDLPETQCLLEIHCEDLVEIAPKTAGATSPDSCSDDQGTAEQDDGTGSKAQWKGMSRSDAQRIRQALSPVRIKALSPILKGISQERKYRVTTAGNDEYFVKIFATRLDGSLRSHTCNEIEKTVWAAAKGFGPQVIVSDTKQGFLMTQYLTNELDRWEDGAVEPRLSETLSLMRALHRSEISENHGRYPTRDAVVYWGTECAKLSLQQKQLPLSQLGKKIIDASIDRLSDMPYRAVIIHGDFHQWNVIFAGGRAWLIDWPFSIRGDAMEDVAFYAYRADIRGFNEFERILKKYDSTLSQADVDRAKCRFALMHVRVYIEVLLETSPEKAEWKKERLMMIEADLLEDAEWLGLEPVGLALTHLN
jgi:thiamine kinase-like enzyme